MIEIIGGQFVVVVGHEVALLSFQHRIDVRLNVESILFVRFEDIFFGLEKEKTNDCDIQRQRLTPKRIRSHFLKI